MTTSTLTQRRGNFYDVGFSAEWYTAVNLGVSAFKGAVYDDSGNRVRDLATVTPPNVSNQRCIPIYTDPSGTVGDHAILVGHNYLSFVWDVDAGTLHAGPNGPGWLSDYGGGREIPPGGVNYLSGWIYYLDVASAGTGTAYLQKVRPDLATDLTTVSSLAITSTIQMGAFAVWTETEVLARQASGNYAKFPLDGSTPTEGVSLSWLGTPGFGMPGMIVPSKNLGIFWDETGSIERATRFTNGSTTQAILHPVSWSMPNASEAFANPDASELVTPVPDLVSGGIGGVLRMTWGATAAAQPATAPAFAALADGTQPNRCVPRR